MKSFFLFTALLISCYWLVTPVYGQLLDQRIEQFYAPLDKESVRSGILINQSPLFLWPGKYDGQPTDDTQTLTLDQFGILYGQFRGAAVDRSVLPDPDIYISKVLPNTDLPEHVVELACMIMEYDYISETAVDQGLLEWRKGQVHDVAGRSQSPYRQDTCFAFTSLKPHPQGEKLVFRLSGELLFSNLGWDISTVQIDFDNGQGPLSVTVDEEVEITYAKAGEKTITLYLDKGGVLYRMATTLKIKKNKNLWSNLKMNVPYDMDNPETVSVSGLDLSIFTACDDGKLRKPLIVLEGFGGTTTSDSLFERLSQTTSSDQTLNDYLNTNEFDLIWIDYQNAFAAIEENADRFIAALEWINQRKHNDGSYEPNNLIGVSMGGLVSKLALLKMHNEQGKDAEVERFFSWDAPLRGANYPIGLQAFIRDFVCLAGEVGASTASLQDALFLLDSGAAEDLLNPRITLDCNPGETIPSVSFTTEPPPALFDYIENLEGIAPMNSFTRHISMINGADGGVLQPNIDIGNDLILGLLLHLDEVEGQDGPDFCYDVILRVDAFAATPGTPLVYRRSVNIEIPWVCELAGDETDQEFIAELPFSPATSLDNAPGGNTSLGLDKITGAVEGVFDSLDNVEFGAFTLPLEHFSFIPTVSSLYMPVGTDPATTTPNAGSEIDRWSAPTSNQTHAVIDTRIADVIVDELTPQINGGLVGPLVMGQRYNFGQVAAPDNQSALGVRTERVIAENLNIQNGAALWVNRDGRLAYGTGSDMHNSNPQTFSVYVPSIACEETSLVTVTTEEGGAIVIGEYDNEIGNIGRLYFARNSELVVNGSEGVTIDKHSTLSIGVDANATINDGGIVDGKKESKIIVSGRNSVFHVKDGGTLRLRQGAQLVVEDGGKLIIDAGANIDLWWHPSTIHIKEGGELVINGIFEFDGYGFFQFDKGNIFTQNAKFVMTGQNDRFIRLNEGATLNIDHHGLDFSFGEVEYRASSVIEVGAAANVQVNNMKFEGIETEPNKNRAFYFNETSRVIVWTSQFENLAGGIEMFGNYMDEIFDVRHCEFNECVSGINVLQANKSMIVDCAFDAGNEGVSAVDIIEVPIVGITSCNVSNYSSSVDVVGAVTLTEVESAYLSGCHLSENDKAIVLVDVPTLRMFGGQIENNHTAGILVPVKIDGSANRSNIFMFSQARINDNAIGISIPQGGSNDPSGNLYGMVLMDCAGLINNGTGIEGNNIVLQIDAYINAGTSQESDIRPNIIYGNGLHFDICYTLGSLVDEVPARGNYWGGGQPIFWDYKLNNGDSDCATFGGILDFSDYVDTEPVGCNKEDGPIEPNDDTIGIGPVIGLPSDTLTDGSPSCFMGTGDDELELHSLHRSGYNQFRAGMYAEATNTFTPPAGISSFEQAVASPVCKHYINVAKVMAYAADQPPALAIQNVETSSIITQDNLAIFPNPVGSTVTVHYDAEHFDISISDLMGRIIYVDACSFETNVDVQSWQEGLYVVTVTNTDTDQAERRKIIVKR